MKNQKNLTLKKVLVLNPSGEDLCRTIKAVYYKMGWTNFTRQMGGRKTDSQRQESLKSMKKIVPINTTSDGCAFTLVARYEGRCNLKCLTGGGGYFPATGVFEVIDGLSDKSSTDEHPVMQNALKSR